MLDEGASARFLEMGGGTARGSTAVAAIRTGRRFIGMEKDEHFYKIAVERIAKEREGLV